MKKRAMSSVTAALLLAACDGKRKAYLSNDWKKEDDSNTTVAVIDTFKDGDTSHGSRVYNTLTEQLQSNEVEVIKYDVSKLISYVISLTLVESLESEPEVISISLASKNNLTKRTINEDFLNSKELWENDVIIVGAAGNSSYYGSSSSRESVYQISVGAVESQNTISYYSNYHPKVVDFYANGYSAPYDYYLESQDLTVPIRSWGTSYSTPNVAAMIADLKEYNKDYTSPEIRTLLELNCEYVEHEDGFVYQVLNDITIFEHTINTRVIVEAGYELFDGCNPTQDNLNSWVSLIDTNQKEYDDLFIELTTNDIQEDNVAWMELAQAHYHWYEHREATVDEVLLQLEVIEDNYSSDFIV